MSWSTSTQAERVSTPPPSRHASRRYSGLPCRSRPHANRATRYAGPPSATPCVSRARLVSRAHDPEPAPLVASSAGRPIERRDHMRVATDVIAGHVARGRAAFDADPAVGDAELYPLVKRPRPPCRPIHRWRRGSPRRRGRRWPACKTARRTTTTSGTATSWTRRRGPLCRRPRWPSKPPCRPSREAKPVIPRRSIAQTAGRGNRRGRRHRGTPNRSSTLRDREHLRVRHPRRYDIAPARNTRGSSSGPARAPAGRWATRPTPTPFGRRSCPVPYRHRAEPTRITSPAAPRAGRRR